MIFLLLFGAIFALHAWLLALPYVWDEAGYYVPAAHDLYISGSLIPHSTVTNAHPPLVLAWVALWWKAFGYAPVVARSAILALAAFALLGVYRLAERANNASVAVGTVLLTALYPVFFAQSSLVHLDLAAAGFTFWALRAYLDDRRFATFCWFGLAALAKETAILAPVALVVWEIAGPLVFRGENKKLLLFPQRSFGRLAALVASGLPLVIWFVYHYTKTGFIFGNPEFFRYNVQATANPLRIVLALFARVWQTFGYMGLWAVTLVTVIAMALPARRDGTQERERIAIPIQITFGVVILAYVLALSVVGGAVLSRYMLPVVPLVLLIGASTVWRRVARWRLVLGGIAALFVATWFWNPPYSFPFEDNLAYRDYVQLHQAGATYLEEHFAQARVLTAWTASDELNRPWLGYVRKPMRIVRIENFSAEEIRGVAAARIPDNPAPYDVVLAFSTKYEAPLDLSSWPPWERLKVKFFGYHQDLAPEAIAEILGGRIVMVEHRRGQWIAVIAMEAPVDAELLPLLP